MWQRWVVFLPLVSMPLMLLRLLSGTSTLSLEVSIKAQIGGPWELGIAVPPVCYCVLCR